MSAGRAPLFLVGVALIAGAAAGCAGLPVRSSRAPGDDGVAGWSALAEGRRS
jgi:hypothetical protein